MGHGRNKQDSCIYMGYDKGPGKTTLSSHRRRSEGCQGCGSYIRVCEIIMDSTWETPTSSQEARGLFDEFKQKSCFGLDLIKSPILSSK